MSGDNVETTKDPTGGPDAWKAATLGPPPGPDSQPLALSGVTCATASLCVAVGTLPTNCTYYHGAIESCEQTSTIATSTDPTAGAGAWHLVYGGPAISTVSCPSVSLCVGAGDHVLASSTSPTGASSTWHATTINNSAFAGVSCPSTAECVAVGDDASLPGVTPAGAGANLATSTNPLAPTAAWTTSTLASTTHYLTAGSCPSISLCVVTDTSGNVITSTRPTEAGPWRLRHIDRRDEPGSLIALSCPSVRLCVAFDSDGYVFASSAPAGGARSWAGVHVVDVKPSLIHPESTLVSCPSTRFCLAIDSFGRLLFSKHPAGGAGSWKVRRDERLQAIDGLSCPSVSLCVAVGAPSALVSVTPLHSVLEPTALVSRRPTGERRSWNALKLEPHAGLDGVSCPSRSLCVAADDRGDILTSTQRAHGFSSWKTRTIASAGNGGGVSCLSLLRCFVYFDQGGVFTSTRPTGRAKTWRRASLAIQPQTITCSSSMCISFDTQGDVVVGRPRRTG